MYFKIEQSLNNFILDEDSLDKENEKKPGAKVDEATDAISKKEREAELLKSRDSQMKTIYSKVEGLQVQFLIIIQCIAVIKKSSF